MNSIQIYQICLQSILHLYLDISVYHVSLYIYVSISLSLYIYKYTYMGIDLLFRCLKINRRCTFRTHALQKIQVISIYRATGLEAGEPEARNRKPEAGSQKSELEAGSQKLESGSRNWKLESRSGCSIDASLI